MITTTTARALAADPDLGPMLRDHWGEVAKNKHLMVLDFDAGRYAAAEDAGQLLVLRADINGRLAGYSVNIVSQHLHYAGLRVCNNDVLFVPRAARGALGVRLMRATEDAAAAAGCRMMGWHAKEDTDLQRILPRMGYGVQDIVYTKELIWDGTQQQRCS